MFEGLFKKAKEVKATRKVGEKVQNFMSFDSGNSLSIEATDEKGTEIGSVSVDWIDDPQEFGSLLIAAGTFIKETDVKHQNVEFTVRTD